MLSEDWEMGQLLTAISNLFACVAKNICFSDLSFWSCFESQYSKFLINLEGKKKSRIERQADRVVMSFNS